jgi:hypothetical protein
MEKNKIELKKQSFKNDLDWLIDLLNPYDYDKVDITDSNSTMTRFLYKKNDINYMFLCKDIKKEYTIWYLDYDLIRLVFNAKFGNNYDLFISLTKNILEKIYDQKVDSITDSNGFGFNFRGKEYTHCSLNYNTNENNPILIKIG